MSGNLDRVYEHFIHNVLPANDEYYAAEDELSAAHAEAPDSERYAAAQRQAVRKAANLAIAFDGLVDRVRHSNGMTRAEVLAAVGPLCKPRNWALREGALEHIEGVANAYKHDHLRANHPIKSMDDILAVGSGFGIDGFGVGKMGAPEVLLHLKDNTQRKYLGDIHAAKEGWRAYLVANGFPDLPA